MPHLVIVSEQDFYEVQNLLYVKNPNKTGPRPTRRGSLLLTGLLYCGKCGKKFTSASFHQARQRADGSIWEYNRDTYRCSSYLVPKEGQANCNQKIFNAEKLEKVVIRDAKNFLRDFDKDKLMRSHEDSTLEKKSEFSERLKKLSREIAQREKEIAKLKDEVIKVILGNSTFSQSLLSELIQNKETELSELKEQHTEIEQEIAELDAELVAQKSICSDLDTWVERF